MRTLSFAEWWMRQNDRDDPIGDVARDAAFDPKWPDRGDYDDLCEHLPYDLRWIVDDAEHEYHEALDSGECEDLS